MIVENKKLEIACFNLESAIIAQQNGADRVELCSNMLEGGTTPDIDIIRKTRSELSIKLNVMVRPRGGDFVYSDAEFDQMKMDIVQFKKLNIDGLVFGILNPDYSFDNERNKELVLLAKPLSCTFHRAFDRILDRYNSLESIIECGFTALLTSGTSGEAVNSMLVLKNLVEQANNRIEIIPGGGVRSMNIEKLDKTVEALFYHSSAITDSSEIANGFEVAKLKSYLKD